MKNKVCQNEIKIAGYLANPKIAGYFPKPGPLHEENKRWVTLENKKNRKQQIYLEALQRTGVIKLAMNEADIGSRQTLVNYRLYDPVFAEQEMAAINKWKADMDDMAIGALVLELQAREPWAIKFWLERRHDDFKPKASLSIDNAGELEKQRSALLELEKAVLKELRQNNHAEATIANITQPAENASS